MGSTRMNENQNEIESLPLSSSLDGWKTKCK